MRGKSRFPILQQILDAPDDQARARLLLSCPDSVLLTYAEAFYAVCAAARFAAGTALIEMRIDAMRAVRDEAGLLPDRVTKPLEELRRAMARYAGAPPEPDPCAPPESVTDL